MNKESAKIADHFLRHEAGKLRAALTNVLGAQYLDLCEDIIQESIYRALTKWPVGGLPPDPAGWIFKTARNIAIDHIRRDKLLASKSAEIIDYLNQFEREEPYRETQLKDELLRMIFNCCHPKLNAETQVIMTLKILGSFHNREIANALLKKESAIEKAVGRGKQKMRDLIQPESLNDNLEVETRLDGVLNVIYLMFNEGYKASEGNALIREHLVLESIRLAKLLSNHPQTNLPRVNALLALLLFSAARMATRISSEGDLLLLKEQDRSKWDENLIAEAQTYLNLASTGDELSHYHLLAGIAACHAFAKSFETTNWTLIIDLYDVLIVQQPSPLFILNRIVAVLYAQGPLEAEKLLKELDGEKSMQHYYLYYMVQGEVYLALADNRRAQENFRLALKLVTNKVESRYIEQKIDQT